MGKQVLIQGEEREAREKQRINNIDFWLKRLYQSLLKFVGEVQINETNSIFVDLPPVGMTTVPIVEDHQVPVRIIDIDQFVDVDWDLTVQEIIPFVDGVNYVKRISDFTAARHQVNLELVRKAIQQLVHFEMVTMIDIFQYSNIYVPTSGVTELYDNKQMQEECCSHVQLRPASPKPTWAYILRLYCSLQRGVRLNRFCQDFKLIEKNVDPRKFVTFGLVNGLTRRVFKYPIVRPPPEEDETEKQEILIGDLRGGEFLAGQESIMESSIGKRKVSGNLMEKLDAAADDDDDDIASDVLPPSTAAPKQIQKSIGIHLDGFHTYDEICCAFGASYSQLDAVIRRVTDCVVISR